ncbi:hypothetical protein LTR65_006154 [Meristemomyces frigidus]
MSASYTRDMQDSWLGVDLVSDITGAHKPVRDPALFVQDEDRPADWYEAFDTEYDGSATGEELEEQAVKEIGAADGGELASTPPPDTNAAGVYESSADVATGTEIAGPSSAARHMSTGEAKNGKRKAPSSEPELPPHKKTKQAGDHGTGYAAFANAVEPGLASPPAVGKPLLYPTVEKLKANLHDNGNETRAGTEDASTGEIMLCAEARDPVNNKRVQDWVATFPADGFAKAVALPVEERYVPCDAEIDAKSETNHLKLAVYPIKQLDVEQIPTILGDLLVKVRAGKELQDKVANHSTTHYEWLFKLFAVVNSLHDRSEKHKWAGIRVELLEKEREKFYDEKKGVHRMEEHAIWRCFSWRRVVIPHLLKLLVAYEQIIADHADRQDITLNLSTVNRQLGQFLYMLHVFTFRRPAEEEAAEIMAVCPDHDMSFVLWSKGVLFMTQQEDNNTHQVPFAYDLLKHIKGFEVMPPDVDGTCHVAYAH